MKKKSRAFIIVLIIVCCVAPIASAQRNDKGESANENKYLPYDDVMYFSEGLATFCNYDDEEKSVCGFIDKNGKVHIPAQYESATNFYEGLSGVSVNGKWGFIDRQGQMVIQPQYDDIAIRIRDGMIQVMKNDKWGYIDKTGKEVIALQYDEINIFGEGLAHVLKNGKYGYLNKTGEFLIQPQYAAAFPFTEELAAVSLNEKWGYVNKKNQVVIPYRYDYAYPFTYGLAAVQLDEKWGFIDHNGNEVVPIQYDFVSEFNDGLAGVERVGLHGFIDRNGNEVIKPQYEYVSDFSDGLAFVKTRDEYGLPIQGYINKKNQRVIGFTSGEWEFNGGPFENGKGVVSDGGDGTYYIVDKPQEKMNVQPIAFRVMVDGEQLQVQVFEMDGSIFIKLRDLAMLLNNTDKSFKVEYNNEAEIIYMTTPKKYTPVSGELATSLFNKEISAIESNVALEINGDYMTMDAYTVQGNNYFRLTDMAYALNFGINEDLTGRSINIDTSSEFLSHMSYIRSSW
ncbi:WG repeat-containing protein [Paenibacillus sp. HB172176]|uniref:WG repeat-containing protein n=1 Tax=Paenibacillus sp. HB172176 TaxID=2493690 RepID=UPI0014392FBC|nr:WG repeat-containing protein [Paenibacillus sp. HB172176]